MDLRGRSLLKEIGRLDTIKAAMAATISGMA